MSDSNEKSAKPEEEVIDPIVQTHNAFVEKSNKINFLSAQQQQLSGQFEANRQEIAMLMQQREGLKKTLLKYKPGFVDPDLEGPKEPKTAADTEAEQKRGVEIIQRALKKKRPRPS